MKLRTEQTYEHVETPVLNMNIYNYSNISVSQDAVRQCIIKETKITYAKIALLKRNYSTS